MVSFKLKKFDMSSIKKGSIVMMIGKRNTGKSFLIKDFLYHKRDIPIGTVISGTEGANHFYSNMMPSLFIHEDFSPDIIQNFLKRQKLATRRVDQQITQYGQSNIDNNAFLVMDDLMFDSSWIKDESIKYIFFNGRHIGITACFGQQYAISVPPSLRGQIDYVFILRENIASNRKRLYEHYAGMFPTFDIFQQVLDKCTENYECLVIDNTTKSNKLDDQVFWYKADSHPDFKIGAPQFWQYHNSQYSADDCEEEEEELTNDVKRKLQVNIKKC